MHMWTSLRDQLLETVNEWLLHLVNLLLSNLLTIAGFILALIVIRRALLEKRSPANFFAWFFFVVLVPILGVPLYLLFGGRKSRRLIRSKQAIYEAATAIAEQGTDPPTAHDILAYELTSACTTGNHTELLPDGWLHSPACARKSARQNTPSTSPPSSSVRMPLAAT